MRGSAGGPVADRGARGSDSRRRLVPGRHLIAVLPLATPLVALGLRRMPRVGIALALVSVGIAGWVYVDARWAGGTLATVASHQPRILATKALGLSA
jgi:hypothetical protein